MLDPALMRAIVERPLDANLRLVAADWLEESGHPEHSEFIRVQCELAELPEPIGMRHDTQTDCDKRAAQYDALKARERDLLQTDMAWTQWGARVKLPGRAFDYFCGNLYPGNTDGIGFCQWFQRGFVERIQCNVSDWIGEQCWACNGRGNHPAIQRERFVDGIVRCSECSMTGQLNATGLFLVSHHPITKLRLTGKRPLKVEGLEDYRWSRYRHPPDDSWTLPAILFDRLLPDRKIFRVRDDYIVAIRAYQSEQDALDGLALAAIRWARETAELPDLDT